MKKKRSARYKINLKRKSHILMLLVVILVAALGTKMLFFSRAATNVPVGIYNGYGKVADHNSFASWLGGPVPYASDYIDYRNNWDTDFNTNASWLLQQWGTWVKGSQGRQLVLGVPLLENSNPGQFAQGTAGAFDPYFQGLGQKLVSNGLSSSVIRLGYEANAPDIGPWQACDNPTGYIAYYRHIVSVMRSVPGQNFKFDWNPTAGSQCAPGKPLNSFASFYPGDDVVDIIGLDRYDIKWMDTTSTPQQRWQYFLNEPMGLNEHKAFAAAHNKPISFPEWGLYARGNDHGGGGDNPYYIEQMAAWFANNNTAYQVYFNIDWGGGVLSNFPNGQARYKALFAPATATSTDTTMPTINLTAPTAGATVAGTVNASGTASDAVGVSKVELYVDGQLVGSTSQATYSIPWDTTKASNANHTLVTKAHDGAGNVGSSAPVTVAVKNGSGTVDTTAPTVNIASPASNAIFGGKSIYISANARDNVGVTNMELYIDGSRKTTTSNASLSYTWGIKKVSSGTHTITVTARDGAGNTGRSTITITIKR